MNKLKQKEKYSDEEIIETILKGETAWFEIIIRRYNSYLYKTGRSYGYNQHDTEDLMQETYINAFVHLAKFERRSSLKTWLVTIMLNNCYQRKQKFSFTKEKTTENNLEENAHPLFTQNSTTMEKNIINKELGHVLEKAIREIPEEYRMVFTLRELNGMSTTETSNALNISESNVKVRLSRAKTMLRSEIEKMYLPEDIYEFNLVYCNRIVENVMKAVSQVQVRHDN
jgi:RNA polymerase sigma factor (sigma-70 family)